MILLVVRRLLVGLLTLWAASVLVFAGTELLPGDVATAILGQEKTPEAVEALRAKLGLDRPAPVRYFDWLTGLLSGEMGNSLVLIAGGIGITPLMSMIRYVHEAKLDVSVTLLYSARVPSELAFYDELREIETANSNIRCRFTVTQPQDEPWDGRVGRIDLEMMREHITDKNSLFYICGPSELPVDIKQSLRDLGVDDSRVHAEEW